MPTGNACGKRYLGMCKRIEVVDKKIAIFKLAQKKQIPRDPNDEHELSLKAPLISVSL
jgi:hypothetical protein